MNRSLGLDYGRARVGVAVQGGTLAEPLEVIFRPEEVIPRLRSICNEYRVTQLIIGVSEQAMAQESKTWGEALGKELELPIIFQDEALSSIEVQTRLRQVYAGKKQYRGAIDHFAAAVILERYLDETEDFS